jgi:hypothetical protein
MTLVLDDGALVALERGDRELMALLKRERRAERSPVTHGGVVGQVWRSRSGRQANLARALPALDVRALDEGLGRRAGVLLGLAGTADVIDAALVLLVHDGDEVLTSDPGDIAHLASHADLHVDVIPI